MLIAKRFSLRPDKLVLYNEITIDKNINNHLETKVINNNSEIHTKDKYKYHKVGNNYSYQCDMFQSVNHNNQFKIGNNNNSGINIENLKQSNSSRNNLKRKYHNFNISINAHRTMKNKINWLFYLSKNRYKQTYSKKHIYNFRMCFITLTLPSSQIHSTSFITKNIWNQFLIEIRSRSKMSNYVWRLEFQNNNNVHYHLVTDSYLDYFFIKKIWNRIIEKYGYITRYKNRFESLSLLEYSKTIKSKYNTDFETIKKRYIQGKKEKWNNPNSVDVKSVINKQSIANYISKYFGKNSNNENNCNPLDNESNSKSLRLWFCSRTLSKVKSITDYIESFKYNIKYCIEKCTDYKVIVHRYVTVIYFKFKSNYNRFTKLIHHLLRNYAYEMGYKSAL